MTLPSPIRRYAQDRPDPLGPFSFVHPREIDHAAMLIHLRDPSIARHLPLLPGEPDASLVESVISSKAICWSRDGLGHWGILHQGRYAGWGGFQLEADSWDFGLVLRREHFRNGRAIAIQAFDWARQHTDIDTVTFLLPYSRSERALRRLGAIPSGEIVVEGTQFRKWSLTLGPSGATRP